MTCDEIWVLAEIRDGNLTRTTRQLVGAARSLAEGRDLGAAAVLAGGEQAHADELAQLAPLVLWLKEPRLEPYEATRYLSAMWQLIESRGKPVAILASSNSTGQELMPRLAARAHAGYASSVVDLRWEGDELAARRPVYGGRVYEELTFGTRPAVFTIRPGSFPLPDNIYGESPGRIETISVDLPEPADPRVVDRQSTASGRQDLAEASRVVAGGRGMGDRENFRLLEELAEALGAAVGASRAVVDAGWRPQDEQVGKSGKTICPELYIACGISGAIHHVLGMNTSKVIVAINSDPQALIFQNADFGLVGDALQVVPALTKALS